jgi:hypothetical protein
MNSGMIQLNSSFLKAAGYFGDTLRIEMHNGRVYDMPHVPYELFEGLIRADSPGQFFNEYLRGKFK